MLLQTVIDSVVDRLNSATFSERLAAKRAMGPVIRAPEVGGTFAFVGPGPMTITRETRAQHSGRASAIIIIARKLEQHTDDEIERGFQSLGEVLDVLQLDDIDGLGLTSIELDPPIVDEHVSELGQYTSAVVAEYWSPI